MKYLIYYTAPYKTGECMYEAETNDPREALDMFYEHIPEPTFISMKCINDENKG